MFTAQDELIRKADLTIADLTTGGGILNEEQAMNFIQDVIKRPGLMPMMTVRSTTKPTYEESKIKFGSSVLRPGVDGQALTSAERVKPDFTPTSYTPQLFKAETRFTRGQIEDNIAGGRLEQWIMSSLAEAAARDLEQVVLHGDTTGTPGSFLSVFDGLIKQAVSNIVPGVGTTLDANVFRSLIKVIESEYLDKSKVKFWTSVDAEQDWRDTIALRQTASGDEAFGATPAANVANYTTAYSSIAVQPLQLMPEDLGVGSDETVCMLFNPKNAIMVWRRDVLVETDYDVSAGAWIVVMSMRVTAGYIEERGVAKATGIEIAA